MTVLSSLDKTLRQFEAAEANLTKLERLWTELHSEIPGGIVFVTDDDYGVSRRVYENILGALPMIDGFKPRVVPLALNAIAQARMDAQDIGLSEAIMSVEEEIHAPGRELREYRFKLHQLRRTLVRQSIPAVNEKIDDLLHILSESHLSKTLNKSISDDLNWSRLMDAVSELNTLIGDSISRPSRWGDLQRHLRFGQVSDLIDIVKVDWPLIKDAILEALIDENDPVPSEVSDLADLVAQKPSGPIASKLKWDNLSYSDFERLIFTLISSEPGYENADWVMHTHAPDKGRDISAYRVSSDGLSGVQRKRVIVQCKHYLRNSINISDISVLKEQIKLWEPPRIDVLIIATSGRFSADAVMHIERHNQSDSALFIEMWSESHLENVLAKRPGIIGEFQLR